MTPHSTSYDLQVFANGGWHTVKTFRSRDEAIRRAQTLETGPGREAVRVVFEVFDPEEARFRQETIFRRSILNHERIESARSDMAVSRLLRTRQRAEPAARAGAAPRDEDWPLLSEIGVRVLILMIAAAVTLALLERMVS